MTRKDTKVSAFAVSLHIVNSLFIRSIGVIAISLMLSEPWFILAVCFDIGFFFDFRRFIRKQIINEIKKGVQHGRLRNGRGEA